MDFESKDQLDNSISQPLEVQPEENKQRMEELGEEVWLLTVDANPIKADMQALKIAFDGQLEKRKRVGILRFHIQWAKGHNWDSRSRKNWQLWLINLPV